MSNRNQNTFNANHYPHQGTYANYQPGTIPNNGQGEYNPNQQPVYYAVGSQNPSYNYPQGGPEAYAYAPAFPMAPSGAQGYLPTGDNAAHYMPTAGTAPWTGGSTQHPVSGEYQAIYGSVNPALAAVGNGSWTEGYPMARSSTPQTHAHRHTSSSYQNQPISLMESTGEAGGNSDQSSSSTHKFRCPVCTSPHARKADLERHIRSVHTQESPYQCLGCNQRFVRSDARGLHWKNEPACKANHLKREGH